MSCSRPILFELTMGGNKRQETLQRRTFDSLTTPLKGFLMPPSVSKYVTLPASPTSRSHAPAVGPIMSRFNGSPATFCRTPDSRAVLSIVSCHVREAGILIDNQVISPHPAPCHIPGIPDWVQRLWVDLDAAKNTSSLSIFDRPIKWF